MTCEPSILEVRQAEAEAVSRVVRGWQVAANPGARARALEALAQEGLEAPKRLRALASDVLKNRPSDGTLLAYMNQQRQALSACFAASLELLRATRDQARASEQSGWPIPSLPALQAAIAAAELEERATFAHWEVFDPHDEIGPPDDYISHEEFMKRLEDLMSPEARRELKNRLAQGGI